MEDVSAVQEIQQYFLIKIYILPYMKVFANRHFLYNETLFVSFSSGTQAYLSSPFRINRVLRKRRGAQNTQIPAPLSRAMMETTDAAYIYSQLPKLVSDTDSNTQRNISTGLFHQLIRPRSYSSRSIIPVFDHQDSPKILQGCCVSEPSSKFTIPVSNPLLEYHSIPITDMLNLHGRPDTHGLATTCLLILVIGRFLPVTVPVARKRIPNTLTPPMNGEEKRKRRKKRLFAPLGFSEIEKRWAKPR